MVRDLDVGLTRYGVIMSGRDLLGWLAIVATLSALGGAYLGWCVGVGL